MFKWSLLTVVIVLIAASAWARLAPSDPKYWHVFPHKPRDIDEAGGALRLVEAKEGDLERLDRIIRAEPRTTVLAGAVADGMVTYITRSAVFGFPDYTTVRQDGAELAIYGRLRMGYSDLGVNAARIDRWLALLAQGG